MPHAKKQSEALLHDTWKTIAYFSLQNVVLTPTDVWHWLYRPSRDWTLEQVLQAVRTLHAQSRITMRDGRVVVSGNEALFAVAHEQFLDAYQKWKRARRVAWWAALVPGVRAVAVGNTLAWESTEPKSDIDLFVIARTGSLWFVRLLCVAPLMLLRARPGVRAQHAIDFTFFVSDQALNLQSVALEGSDPYLAYWITSLVPFVDDGVWETFWEQNAWATRAVPHATPVRVAWYRRVRHGQRAGAVFYRVLRVSGLIWLFNKVARVLSVARFPQGIRTAMNTSTGVVVNNEMLKFHTQDTRERVRTEWEALCRS